MAASRSASARSRLAHFSSKLEHSAASRRSCSCCAWLALVLFLLGVELFPLGLGGRSRVLGFDRRR
jgi:hypothetical protein